MKRIRQRRTRLRVNNPVAFGILCAMILVLFAGCAYALAAGVIAPGVNAYRDAHATPSPSPTVEPVSHAATPTPSPTAPPATDTPTQPPVSSGKLAGHVIGIDPARSYTSKIKGASTGVYANRLNLAVALLLKDALEAEGATVVMTYTEVRTTIDDAARAKTLNNGNVEVALRIECNSVNASDTRGALTWVPSKHDKQTDCVRLAQAVLNGYINKTNLSKRLYDGSSVRQKGDEEIFTRVEAPICTLIIGHISNRTEDKKLNDESFQKTMAQGIADGFITYFGE